LIVARGMSTRPGRVARVVLVGTAIAGVALGVAILRADAAFAGLGRRAVAELISPNVAAGHRVWFTPHWGFQWYAEKAGARPVTRTPPFPSSGDLLVTSQNTDESSEVMAMLVRRYPRVRHVARIEEREPGGRLMSHTLGAGFFSNEWGYLPWVWSDEVLDAFDLWQLD
jgi:pimeloyl-ACP methyl ester carboxylesterase